MRIKVPFFSQKNAKSTKKISKKSNKKTGVRALFLYAKVQFGHLFYIEISIILPDTESAKNSINNVRYMKYKSQKPREKDVPAEFQGGN